ncbi:MULTISPECIES: L-rhamnose mutarotase [Salegentibacter]|jgi:L-rhamnose mutarotase|uniref:L-rhamnose mutarotase n=1 Tax=Salegentibacter agarivorans TaxID=345907 RepID=A0A1I2MZI4_9FLAO|nr:MULTISPECIES: L-rhamnose mutarotase [Salegentibacter]SFF96853.1 L-rhamnose mutarotase [Salegentibacter agarivorans]
MKTKKYVLACDLKDEVELIKKYEEYHREVWPEIIKSILEVGILNMEIFRTGNRLVMIIDTQPDFSFEMKAKADKENPKVQEWESLMQQYQQAIPSAKNGEKWTPMDKIFDLKNT